MAASAPQLEEHALRILRGKPHRTLSSAHSVLPLMSRKKRSIINNTWKIKKVETYEQVTRSSDKKKALLVS